jgi:hypothetical protein
MRWLLRYFGLSPRKGEIQEGECPIDYSDREPGHPLVERCYQIVDQSKDLRRAIGLIEMESIFYNSTAVDALKEAERKLEEEWKVLAPYFDYELQK